MPHHNLVEEPCRTHHDGEDFPEEVDVAGEEPVLPEVLAHPRASRGPQSGGSLVDGSRDAPDVGVVVEHPSVGAVHDARGLMTRLADIADEREEGCVEVGEVGDLRRPVVHLTVDVGGVFGVPVGEHLVVPDALQGGRLATRLRGADEEVSAKLEVGLHEVVVLVALELLHPTVGGDGGEEVGAEVETDTVEVFLVMCHVALSHRAVVLLEGLAQDVLREDGVVAADVGVVLEVGGDGHIDDGLVGTGDGEHAVSGGDASTLDGGGEPSGEGHLALQSLVVGGGAAEDHLVAFAADGHVGMGRGEVGVAGDGSRPVGGEPHGDDVA